MPKVRFTVAVEGDRNNPAGFGAGSEWWLSEDQALALAEQGVCDIIANDPAAEPAASPAALVDDLAAFDSEEA